MFATRGYENQKDTWIDHILYSGEHGKIHPTGAFNSVAAEWKVASDHWPIWQAFHTSLPTTDPPTRATKATKRPEIPLTDYRQIAEFERHLDKIIKRIPYEGDNDAEAETYLDNVSKFIVDTTATLNAKYHKKSRDVYKDGVSPQFLLTSWHLQAIIEIRRRLTGEKGRFKWDSRTRQVKEIQAIFEGIVTQATGLGLQKAETMEILTQTDRGPHWWAEAGTLTPAQCDDEIKRIKKLLHGRQRKEARLKWKQRNASLTVHAQTGRIGKIIKTVLGQHAGRKHRDGLNLDTLKEADKTHVTPETVHDAATRHFNEWFVVSGGGWSN
jgi:hypothetical protein